MGIVQIPNEAEQQPFGVSLHIARPFVVLDKSFLDAVSSAQLKFYGLNGIVFGVPEVLIYELMRKSDDDQRTRSLLKLSAIRGLLRLPSVGEMFRAEGEKRKPAPSALRAQRLWVTPLSESSNPFALTPAERRTTEQRTAELRDKRLPLLLGVWRDLGSMPQLRGVTQSQLPEKLAPLKQEILENGDSMRQFYANHRRAPLPPATLLDERWASFRWIQVYLLAGLDFFHRHGLHSEPNRENLLHELIDLDYTITALLVGGLACREKRIIERFRFLRPDGFVLYGPRNEVQGEGGCREQK